MTGKSPILFTHAYFLRFDPKQWKTKQPYPPLGTLYAAAVMREAGCTVAFEDMMFAREADDILPAIREHKPFIFVIYDDGFNYLTKMCLTNMREAAFRMIQLAKENNCTVIVSSSDSTDRHEHYLQAGADFVLLGEAEQTLQELVNAIENGISDFTTIQGLAFRQYDRIIKTAKRNVLKFLDGLPFPAWDLLNITPYKEMWQEHNGYFSINMATTRGCPFKCNWCAKPIYGNRYNSRSPENVVAEIKYLKDRFDFAHIWFCDDIFGLKPGWVAQFALLMQEAQLVVKYKIQSRADLLLQENYVQALAQSGCENIWMGAESGSQHILDAMDKGTTVEQIHEATKLIKAYHMQPSFFIQFGYPGEQETDINLTIKMITELLPSSIGISVSYPLPGTKFYENVKNELTKKTNWTDSDEMALLFHNTYQPAYYKQLHGYVHKTYQKHLSIHRIKDAFPTQRGAVRNLLRVLYYIPATFFARWKLERLKHIA